MKPYIVCIKDDFHYKFRLGMFFFWDSNTRDFAIKIYIFQRIIIIGIGY
nr:MAG: hypothetical protein [uncultured archaeon]